MSGWTRDEADFLTRHWTNDSDAVLTIEAACPHCLHDGAFRHVSISAYATRGGGGGGLGDAADGVDAAELEGGFPDDAVVSCRCKDPEHEPGDGCGRRGEVRTS